MAASGGLNSLGRILATAATGESRQRWRDFMRALVVGGRNKNLFTRAHSLLPALSREDTGLALEWMVGSEIGVEIIRVAEEALADTAKPW